MSEAQGESSLWDAGYGGPQYFEMGESPRQPRSAEVFKILKTKIFNDTGQVGVSWETADVKNPGAFFKGGAKIETSFAVGG